MVKRPIEITDLPLDRTRSEGVVWLIKLRWFAGALVVGTGFCLDLFVNNVPAGPIILVGVSILAYNTFFRISQTHIAPKSSIHLQIMMDWIALTVLCHYTLGMESPFVFFYIFHIILSSLFVSRASCLRHGVLAITLLAAMVWLEQTGRLQTPAWPGAPRIQDGNGVYTLFFLSAFAALILLAIFLSTTVVCRLRAGEESQQKLKDELQAALKKQVTQDQSRQSFMRVMSHEIRSPMAAVQSMLKVVADGYAGEVSPKAKEMVQRSELRIRQLMELVNELLDLIRGSQPVPEDQRQNIRFPVALAKTIGELSVQASRKEISFQLELEGGGFVFQGDLQDLERIVMNIASNAIKYTPEFGTVRVRGKRLDGDWYQLEITDSGIGIPADEMPRIYDEFYRASNAKKELREGTGLGLAIVKRTIEKYHGEISIQSQLGKGTSVFLKFPQAPAMAALAAE